jgi:hypothetical protein
MKRVIALLVVCMLLVGCTAAFAQQAQEQSAVEKIGGAVKKFFNDLGNLLTKKIPETPQQRSSRQPWDDLVKQKSSD